MTKTRNAPAIVSKPNSLDEHDSIGWSKSLPDDFYRHVSVNLKQATGVLSFGHAASLSFSQLCDVAVRTSLSTLIAGISIPAGYRGDKLSSELKRQGLSRSQLQDAHNLYQAELSQLTVVNAKRPRGVKGGEFVKVSWDSAYGHSVCQTDHYEQNERNRRVCAYHWKHDGKPRPTIIFLHGFAASTWGLNNYFMRVEEFYRRGYDVVLKTLPHHGARSGKGRLLSGFNYISGGVHHLNHSVAQSTFDTRSLLDYLLRNSSGVKVGLCGMSLGGYTSALMAGLESRFEFVMPIVPIISIPDAMMAWRPLDKAISKIVNDHHLDIPTLRDVMAAHSPLSFSPLLPPEKLMIVAGQGDRMALPHHAEALQKHWGDCELQWFRGSHVLPMQRERTLQAKFRFLENIDF